MMPTTRAASTPSRKVTTNASNMGGLSRGRPGRQPGARRCIGARARVAEAADLQRVTPRLEPVGAADLALQRGDARAHELDHPPAAGADQMIVMLAAMDMLVEEAVLPEALLAGEAALDEEIEVAIDRGAGDLEPARLHRSEQLLGVDML